ncbi:hypothetical protein SOPP22_03780 [Shewanella sp. OPT22]|nr:hypothetical protein SOPP22_03780 [Shewanella sp. OPT22]
MESTNPQSRCPECTYSFDGEHYTFEEETLKSLEKNLTKQLIKGSNDSPSQQVVLTDGANAFLVSIKKYGFNYGFSRFHAQLVNEPSDEGRKICNAFNARADTQIRKASGKGMLECSKLHMTPSHSSKPEKISLTQFPKRLWDFLIKINGELSLEMNNLAQLEPSGTASEYLKYIDKLAFREAMESNTEMPEFKVICECAKALSSEILSSGYIDENAAIASMIRKLPAMIDEALESHRFSGERMAAENPRTLRLLKIDLESKR